MKKVLLTIMMGVTILTSTVATAKTEVSAYTMTAEETKRVNAGNGIWNNEDTAEFGKHIEFNEKTGKYNNYRLIRWEKPVKVYKSKSTSSKVLRKRDTYALAYTSDKKCNLSGKWLKVAVGEKGYGYVENKKGTWSYVNSEVIDIDVNLKTTCPTYLYASTDADKKLCGLKQGTKLTCIGYSRYNFYKVKYGDRVGYVKIDHTMSVSRYSDSINKTWKSVNCDVYVYEKDNSNSKVIATLKPNTKVTVVAKRDNACKIKYNGNKTGWVNVNAITGVFIKSYKNPVVKTNTIEKIDYAKVNCNNAITGFNTTNIGVDNYGHDVGLCYVSCTGKSEYIVDAWTK